MFDPEQQPPRIFWNKDDVTPSPLCDGIWCKEDASSCVAFVEGLLDGSTTFEIPAMPKGNSLESTRIDVYMNYISLINSCVHSSLVC